MIHKQKVQNPKNRSGERCHSGSDPNWQNIKKYIKYLEYMEMENMGRSGRRYRPPAPAEF